MKILLILTLVVVLGWAGCGTTGADPERWRAEEAQGHYTRGGVLMQEGKVEAAFAQYREAARLAPEVAVYRGALGNALEQQGRLDEAFAQWRAAFALDPAGGARYLFRKGVSLETLEGCPVVVKGTIKSLAVNRRERRPAACNFKATVGHLKVFRGEVSGEVLGFWLHSPALELDAPADTETLAGGRAIFYLALVEGTTDLYQLVHWTPAQ